MTAPNSDSSPAHPVVSVVIPVYNVEEWLRETLDTVAAQSFTDWECVCVDDGSRDGSADIVREYSRRDPRFRLVTQVNAGAAAARNHGIDEARGEFLIFVDSDDLITPDLLECCVERLRADDSDICAFHIDAFGTPEYQLGKVLIETYVPEGLTYWVFEPRKRTQEAFSVVQPAACNKMYRTAFLGQHELKFPRGLKRSEDTSFGVLVVALANRISCIDKILYHYRQSRPNSQMQSLQSKDVEFSYYYAALEIWNQLHHYDILKEFGADAISISLSNALYYHTCISRVSSMLQGTLLMHRFVKQCLKELRQAGAPPTKEQLARIREKFSWMKAHTKRACKKAFRARLARLFGRAERKA